MSFVRTLVALLACAALARADHEVRTLAGKTVKGPVVGLSATEVTQRAESGTVKTPLAQVLAIDLRPGPKAPPEVSHTLVHLIDDSNLRCKEVTFKGNTAEVKLLSGQSAKVPLASVGWILKEAQDRQVKARWDQLLSAKVKLDRVVVLIKGELNPLEGTLGDVDPQGKTIQFRRESGEIVGLPLERLHGLIFYRTEAPATAAVCTVTDTEGDSLAAAKVAVEGGTFTVTTAAGVQVGLEEKVLARLDYNMGKLTYLSDMEPAKVVQRSGAGLVIRYRTDGNLEGEPILLAGVQHAKGLSLHAHTELEYELGGKYKDFKALLGVDPHASPESRAQVTIECDGERKFSKTVPANAAPEPLSLSVRDVRRLRIIVSSDNFLDLHDQATLAEARVSQ
jgi:hypothetical protein